MPQQQAAFCRLRLFHIKARQFKKILEQTTPCFLIHRSRGRESSKQKPSSHPEPPKRQE